MAFIPLQSKRVESRRESCLRAIATTAATISIEPPSRCRQDCLHHEMIFTNARLIFPDGIAAGLELVGDWGKTAGTRRPLPSLRRAATPVRGNEGLDSTGH